MALDDPARPGCQRECPRAVRGPDLGRGVHGSEHQLGRCLLHPLEGAAHPRHPKPEAVLDPGSSLRHPERAAGAVVEAEQGTGVVVDESVGHDVADLRGDGADLESGDEAQQVVRVGADVTHHQRRPTLDRVVAPRQCTLGIGVAFGGLAALHVFDLDQLDLAELAVGDHGPGLTHHRIARVVVGQAEHEAGVADGGNDVGRLGERVGERFVADHVESRSQRTERVPVVAVVRRHDRDDVGAVRAL